jgi:hypothetical protein
MKSNLEVDTWMGALEWNPETAQSCVNALCAYLGQEPAEVWMRVVPDISAGLECLADNPQYLYRLAEQVYTVSTYGNPKILAMILASVNAALPEYYVQEAIRLGAMVPILKNRNYTMEQRLTWLKEHAAYVFTQGGIGPHEDSLETPIKDALILYFFMSANRGRIHDERWRDVGLTEAEAAEKQFLNTRAPGIANQIELVQALGLSYAAAVDMLIGVGDGKEAAPALGLPALDGAA